MVPYGMLSDINNELGSLWAGPGSYSQKKASQQLWTHILGGGNSGGGGGGGGSTGPMEAQIAADAQRYASDSKLRMYNAMRPQLDQVFSSGGQAKNMIDASPVFTPELLQSQINSMSARNQQAGATQQRMMQDKMAAAGFGSSSPLAYALTARIGNSTRAANTEMETNQRLGAAQANADHVLRAQMAQQEAANEAMRQRLGVLTNLFG